MTISQVSRGLGISTRMLRYYEQAGLVNSMRREGYAYRVYDENAVNRLRQIQMLRRLRIPVKEIKVILGNEDAMAVIRVFEGNIGELDAEITALSTIREILRQFVEQLQAATKQPIRSLLSDNASLLAVIDSLPVSSINFKEDQTMEDLNKATEQLNKITDARIVYLPPATVAVAHYVGDDPEFHAHKTIEAFVKETDLLRIKPDIRHYGFNHPNPKDETGYHGYEDWVTIPDDMEVPAPLEKRTFPGGLYAAHMIRLGNFHEWDWIIRWVNESDQYEFAGNWEDQEHMCGLMEETLNFVHIADKMTEFDTLQLDLLVPVREKKK